METTRPDSPRLTLGDYKPEFGYFYTLYAIQAEHGFLSEMDHHWIDGSGPKNRSGGYDGTWCTYIEGKKLVTSPICKTNPQHGRKEWIQVSEIDIEGGDYSPFIRSSETTLLHEPFAERLRQSELTGWTLHRVERVTYQGDPKQGKRFTRKYGDVYQLGSTSSTFPSTRRRIEPLEANKCPHCHNGPVVCPECGEYERHCARCGKEWLRRPNERQDINSRDKRVIFDVPISINGTDLIDPVRWDGSDFWGWTHRGCVTRRAIEFFIQIHAYPVLGEPVPVNIHEIDPKLQAKLDATKTRVE